MTKQITVPGSLESVSSFTQKLESELAGLSIETRTTVVLAIHELMVNIVEHGYKGKAGQINVVLDLSDSNLRMEIRDRAENPFEMPDDVPELNPLDLREHGMGLFIIQQAFDNVVHTNLEPGNYWLLEKSLVKSHTS